MLLPFAFDVSNSRGKSFTVLWGGVRPPLRVACLVERVTMRYGVSDRLSRDFNLLYHPTPLPFLAPGRAVSTWGFCVNPMSVRAKTTKPVVTLNLALIALPPPLAPSPLQSASQSRCSSPAHLQQGAGSHLQQCLIDLIMQ